MQWEGSWRQKTSSSCTRSLRYKQHMLCQETAPSTASEHLPPEMRKATKMLPFHLHRSIQSLWHGVDHTPTSSTKKSGHLATTQSKQWVRGRRYSKLRFQRWDSDALCRSSCHIIYDTVPQSTILHLMCIILVMSLSHQSEGRVEGESPRLSLSTSPLSPLKIGHVDFRWIHGHTPPSPKYKLSMGHRPMATSRTQIWTFTTVLVKAMKSPSSVLLRDWNGDVMWWQELQQPFHTWGTTECWSLHCEAVLQGERGPSPHPPKLKRVTS